MHRKNFKLKKKTDCRIKILYKRKQNMEDINIVCSIIGYNTMWMKLSWKFYESDGQYSSASSTNKYW